MTDTQLYIAVGIPMFAIVASLIISLVQVSGIRHELTGLREDLRLLRTDFNGLRSDVHTEVAVIREDIKALVASNAALAVDIAHRQEIKLK